VWLCVLYSFDSENRTYQKLRLIFVEINVFFPLILSCGLLAKRRIILNLFVATIQIFEEFLYFCFNIFLSENVI
jgi:hypothetical protein